MPKKIHLAKTSVENLIGNCQEVTVYGFKDCRYYSVMDAFEALNIKVNEWGKTSFPIIPYDAIAFDVKNLKMDCLKATVSRSREYKSIITSLIIENYKRTLINKPIIPLIFCVGLEEANKVIELDVKKVALSHRTRNVGNIKDPTNSSITEKELRRCYKMYAETDPEIQSLIQNTFKFVKLVQDAKDTRTYTLQPVKVFWDEKDWNKIWQDRKNQHLENEFPKEKNWRSIFSSEITQLRSNFFKTNITHTDKKDDEPMSELIFKK